MDVVGDVDVGVVGVDVVAVDVETVYAGCACYYVVGVAVDV